MSEAEPIIGPRSRLLAPHWVGARHEASRTIWNRQLYWRFSAQNFSNSSPGKSACHLSIFLDLSLPLLVSFIPAHAPEGGLPFVRDPMWGLFPRLLKSLVFIWRCIIFTSMMDGNDGGGAAEDQEPWKTDLAYKTRDPTRR